MTFRVLGIVLACAAIAAVGLWLMRREFAYFRAVIVLPWQTTGDYTRLTVSLGTICTDLTGGWRMDVHAAMERRAQTMTGGVRHAIDAVAQPNPGYMAQHAAIGDTADQFRAIVAAFGPVWLEPQVELVHIGGRSNG